MAGIDNSFPSRAGTNSIPRPVCLIHTTHAWVDFRVKMGKLGASRLYVWCMHAFQDHNVGNLQPSVNFLAPI
ncbi:hypothetical protein SK128_006684, partial [Halocaridina rubra]